MFYPIGGDYCIIRAWDNNYVPCDEVMLVWAGIPEVWSGTPALTIAELSTSICITVPCVAAILAWSTVNNVDPITLVVGTEAFCALVCWAIAKNQYYQHYS